jgi:hypothetical protein
MALAPVKPAVSQQQESLPDAQAAWQWLGLTQTQLSALARARLLAAQQAERRAARRPSLK